MLNDPTISRLIIMGLAGTNVVLLLAVIFLAFKKNIYYVDEQGNEVGTTVKPARHAADVKKSAENIAKTKSHSVVQPHTQANVQPTGKSEDQFAATTILTDLERPVMPVSPSIAPVKIDSLDTPIRENSHDDSASPFEEIFTAANLDEVSPKIVISVKVSGTVKEHTIDKLPCLIGREASSCDLIISEPAISRKHARILIEGDTIYLADVSEHNGTYLNGIKLPPLGKARIHEGDHINLGRAEIVIHHIVD